MMLHTVSPVAAVVNFSPGSGCLSVLCAEQRIPCLNIVRTDEQRRLVLGLIREEISKRVRNRNDERFYRLPAAPLPSTTAVPDVSPKAAAVTVVPPEQTVVPPVPATTVVPPVPATVPAPVTTLPGTTAPEPKQSQSEKDSSPEDSESSGDGEDVEK